MKIQIVKDGAIQGWAVSFMITMVSISAFIVSMIYDSFADRFTKVGGIWAAIAVSQFTAWLAYRVFKKGDPPPVQP
jgi:hypothetical protein